MKNILRNTFFLYLSLGGGFLLNLIQIKLLSLHLMPIEFGEFFTINAFGQIVAGILILGSPFVLVRYLPKFHAKIEKKKMASLVNLLILCFLLLGAIGYTFFHIFGYKLGITIYKDEVIGKYLSFGFLVSLGITFFGLIFVAFNGIRKMHYSATLNLLYLSLLTLLIFVFRKKLTVLLVLKIYLISVSPSIIGGLFLLYWKIGDLGTIDFKLFTEIKSYWKYAILLGCLSPLFFYLDRLIVGYFLSIPMVGVFTIASKLRAWAARILDIPIQALAPEISYSWEKKREKIIGEDLSLIIKVYFFITLILAIPILIGGKEIIYIVSSHKYIEAFVPLCFLIFSTILSSLYVPLVTTMRGIGKISLYLYSDVIWIFGYIGLMVLFIPRFGVQGVGVAYLLTTIITLGFNFGYVVRFHTELKIDIKFFYKIIVFSLIFGVISYFVWQYILDGLRWKLLFLFLFVGLGYFMFLLWANIFGTIEKERLKNLFLKRYKLSE